MHRPLTRTLPAALAAALLLASPAAAHPATTGGLPAQHVPALGPSGGLSGPPGGPAAVTAQTDDVPPQGPEPVTPEPEGPPEEQSTDGDEPAGGVPTDGESDNERGGVASTSASGGSSAGGGSGGGPLPHTGFALAALVALGTGFVLTGYALRYSRALDD
jgi:hypothetical protein